MLHPKRLFPLFTLAVIFTFVVLLLPGSASAAEFKNSKDGNVNIGEKEVIAEDLYVSAKSVDIEGYVLGDLFVAGEIIDISGVVEGDVYAAGNSISISGKILGDLFVAGQNITLSGEVTDSVYAASANLFSNGKTAKDFVYFGSMADLNGEIGDDLRLFTAQSSIKAAVGGDAFTSSGKGTIDKKKISGKLYDLSDDAKKVNQRLRDEINQETRETTVKQVLRYVFGLLGLFLLSLLVYKFMPIRLTRIIKRANQGYAELFKAFVVGSAVVSVVPFTLLMLFILGLFAPNILLSLYGEVLWFITVVLLLTAIIGKVAVLYIVGGKIQRKLLGNYGSTWLNKAITGLVFWAILMLLLRIPVIGIVAWVFEFILITIGIGLATMDKVRQLRVSWKQKPVTNTKTAIKTVKAKKSRK